MPRPVISPEQKAAFDAKLKEDATKLGKDILLRVVEHFEENPESVLSQAVKKVEHDTGLVSVILRKIADYRSAPAPEPKPPAPTYSTSSSTSRTSNGAAIVDAEFVDVTETSTKK